jgi:hypothetical protein
VVLKRLPCLLGSLVLFRKVLEIIGWSLVGSTTRVFFWPFGYFLALGSGWFSFIFLGFVQCGFLFRFLCVLVAFLRLDELEKRLVFLDGTNPISSFLHDGCSKHAFKCIRTRMGPIRRKKHAMIRFLKKDIADLLANDLDTHAFGRVRFSIRPLYVSTLHLHRSSTGTKDFFFTFGGDLEMIYARVDWR